LQPYKYFYLRPCLLRSSRCGWNFIQKEVADFEILKFLTDGEIFATFNFVKGWSKFVYCWGKSIPHGIKRTVIFLVLIGIFLWQIKTPSIRHVFLFRLYYLPIFMGSLLDGLRGGILLATLSSFFSFCVSNQSSLDRLDLLFEITLFYFFGVITGFLVNREKREREKAKEAQDLALLGKAAAAIAHELRTPLVVIGGFSRIVQKQLPPESLSWKKLDIILKEAKWMEDIIQGILDFSKPLELELKPTNIKSLIEEVVSLVAPEKERKIQVRFVNPVLKEIRLDPDRFKQVLINLLNNAIQASPDKPVKINVFFTDESMIIEIIDQGPGIPKEYQAKIFEPFFSTKARGTGLGLAIVKKIINAHKGKISFRTSPEKGTTFVITIPTNL